MQLSFDLRGSPAPRKPPETPPPAPLPEAPAPLTVSALTRRIRSELEAGFGEVFVEGEVSNLRRQASGHVYFTLKDAGSQIACVLFAGQTPQLKGLDFRDGAQIELRGGLTVYEPRGNYQIIVRRVAGRGQGALQARLEELKARLAAEGLFATDRKKALPRFPRRLGVVTSPTGAAIRDFLQVLHRRHRGIGVLIHPVRVQGRGAAAEIAAAIEDLNHLSAHGIEPVDVIVVTRGGGSLEDLWEFNEEAVVRAVAASAIPVVSAVGHEIDVSLCDFAADLRAPTPSAAAELLSADRLDLGRQIQHLAHRLHRPAANRLEILQSTLDALPRTALFLEPFRVVRERLQTLDRLAAALSEAPGIVLERLQSDLETHRHRLAAQSPDRRIQRLADRLQAALEGLRLRAASAIDRRQALLDRQAAVLQALNPLASLARGYTVTCDEHGQVLRSATAAQSAATLQTRFADGTVASKPVPPPA